VLLARAKQTKGNAGERDRRRQSDEWTRARYAEAQQIEQLFREAWPRAKNHPGPTACYSLAISLGVVKLRAARAHTPKKPEKPEKLAAIKHARALLRDLAAVRRRWEAEAPEVHAIELVPDLVEHWRRGVDLIGQTEQHVQALLKWMTGGPQPPNAARFIAEKAQEAWRSMKGAKTPKSIKVGPDHPLCRFVTAALTRFVAGRDLSNNTVSDMLRGRERRRRESKRRRKTKAAKN
jgi:hypothetical protein